MPHAKGAVWDIALADTQFYVKRVVVGELGLGCARLQHPAPLIARQATCRENQREGPEEFECELALRCWHRPAEPFDPFA